MNIRIYPIFGLIILTSFASLLSGQATKINAIDKEILPFADFEPKSQKDSSIHEDNQQWYRIDIGNHYFEEEPPGKTFIVNELPDSMKSNVRFITIKTLFNKKHHYADRFLVDRDPLNRELTEPFSIGETIYTKIKGDSSNGLLFSYYYYDSGDVKWETNNTPDPSKHTLNMLELEQEETYLAGKWFVQIISKKDVESISQGKRVTKTLYRYVFIRVTRI